MTRLIALLLLLLAGVAHAGQNNPPPGFSSGVLGTANGGTGNATGQPTITPNTVTDAMRSQVGAGTFKCNTGTSTANMADCAWSNLPANPNVLMNSAMEVDQANEGASISLSSNISSYVADGTQGKFLSSGAIVTAQRVADAPNGFTNSVQLTVGTGAAVAATDFLAFQIPIEADNITDMAVGTSSAVNLCVSWWVKSSIGSYTYAVTLSNYAQVRAYPSNRTVASAATWTQDSFCFTADTTGTWITSGTAGGALLSFYAAVGSTRQGTTNTWQGSTKFSGASPTNTILTTSAATFQITGVKLEISPVVTQYKRNPFWAELTAAQRYYAKTFPPGTAPAQNAGVAGSLCNQTTVTTAGTFDVLWTFPQIMRASPTVTTYNPSAANANIRDITGASDVVVLVDPASAKSQTSVEIGSQTTALTAARALCVQATADARL